MNFNKYIFNLFPAEIRSTDSRIDITNRGLLERYCSLFESELDDNYITYIENLLSNVFDLISMDSKFLIHIAGTLGLPATPTSDPDFYRLLLAYAVRIYQVKGTELSYQMYFRLLGFNVEIRADVPSRGVIYDDNIVENMTIFTYDDEMGEGGSHKYHYDDDCDNCLEYDIAIAKIGDSGWVIDSTWRTLFGKFLSFLEPINAKFRDYVTI